MKTIDYYNKYAEEFTASTFEVDMESLYQPFLAEFPEGTRILVAIHLLILWNLIK